MGIEPTSQAWEAGILPMNYTRRPCPYYSKGGKKFQPLFVETFLSFLVLPCPLCYTVGKGGEDMAEYELVREIQNLCRNNQMRDIFFEEVETDDPVEYVRGFLKGKAVELSVDAAASGAVTVYASCDGLTQKFLFTPID